MAGGWRIMGFGTMVLGLGLSMLISETKSAPESQPSEILKRRETPVITGNLVKFKHLIIDRKARRITLDAKVVQSQYLLEFLLCKTGGKEYESLLATSAEGWQLHAGLLMLGLSPGIPAESKDGKYIPPRGAKLDIQLEYKDAKGNLKRCAAIDWLKFSGKSKAKKPAHWIFLGSDILPSGKYWADAGGGIIALANLPSAVIDVPFESTRALENREFMPDEKVVPKGGMAVKVIITPQKGAEKAEHARALLDIDANGRMQIDGRPILFNSLRAWADAFTDQHQKGRVVIRSASRALCCYAPRVQLELKLGGVFDFDYLTKPLDGPLLPRTVMQMKAELEEFQTKFNNPKDELTDPGVTAESVLMEIQRQREELKKRNDLWLEYERRLKEKLKAYRESSNTADTK